MANYYRFILKIILITLVLLLLLLGCTSKSKDFNIIYISLDTTRYDYIDSGKGARAYTPELRKYAERSIVFENAFSTSTQTLPSHLSIFASLYPHELAVYTNDDKYEGHFKFISEVFEEQGYHTTAIISLGTLNSSTGFQNGFREFREDLFEEKIFFVPAKKITREAIKTIQKLKRERFFLFLHYSDPHTPYAPPEVKGEFRISLDGSSITEFDSYKGVILKERISLSKGSHVLDFMVDHDMDDFSHFVIRGLTVSEECSLVTKDLNYSETLYGGSYKMKSSEAQIRIQCEKDGSLKIFQIIPILKPQSASKYYRLEVEYMDGFVGKLLRFIDEIGLQDNTIVAIFADHGEGHGEREGFFGHTRYLNRQFIQVPLILKIPGYRQKRVSHPVSLVCLSPTILEFLGIRDQNFDLSLSFLSAINGKFEENNLIYSFAFDPPAKRHKLSIINWPFQCIFYMDQGQIQKREFYNLALSQSFSDKDAISADTMSKASPIHDLTFQRIFNEIRETFYPAEKPDKSLGNRDLEMLKALGYIDD
jgi:membrane-anchored protein YejM (alkaline phosphatase superfamily)